MANKRTPAETLVFLIGVLANETVEDRKKILDALAGWFELGRNEARAEAQKGAGHDG